jgi:hypothetical protein
MIVIPCRDAIDYVEMLCIGSAESVISAKPIFDFIASLTERM